MKMYLTLDEVIELLNKPEEWYVPYIPLQIIPPPSIEEDVNGAQAN